MGLGLHGGGVSSAVFFARVGCQVIITDLKQAADLKPSINKLKKLKNIEHVFGRHRKNDFSAYGGSAFGGKKADLIIRNPAVPNNNKFLTIARANKIPVHTDISWFLQFLKKGFGFRVSDFGFPTIVGITGTKGKSTTAALLRHILTKCGKKSLLAGNIRQSPLDFIKIDNTKYLILNTKYLILELSSWHLESLNEHKLAPNLAIITNILPDHLNRYKSFADYKRAKTFIFKHQTANDVLFLNKNDQVSRHIGKNKNIKSKIIWYGERGEKDVKSTSDLKSFHPHPSNIRAVLSIANFLNLNKKTVQQAIKTFPGLEGRLEFVDIIDGVKYYNDTCATQPEATIYAIGKLKTKVNIILIAGGEDKNLDYDNLARAISKNVKTLILFKGSASDKIIKALQLYSSTALKLYKNISSMAQAVAITQNVFEPNDIVLLSPAAASFGLFKHEFDRGKQFKICVKKIKKAKNRIAQTTG